MTFQNVSYLKDVTRLQASVTYSCARDIRICFKLIACHAINGHSCDVVGRIVALDSGVWNQQPSEESSVLIDTVEAESTHGLSSLLNFDKVHISVTARTVELSSLS